MRVDDTLMMPRLRQYVSVTGEAQDATAHLGKSNLDRDDYIASSGGMTSRADTRRIYVERADGSVIARYGNRRFGSSEALAPESAIAASIDAERRRALPLWAAVTTIIYNQVAATAAVGSL